MGILFMWAIVQSLRGTFWKSLQGYEEYFYLHHSRNILAMEEILQLAIYYTMSTERTVLFTTSLDFVFKNDQFQVILT